MPRLLTRIFLLVSVNAAAVVQVYSPDSCADQVIRETLGLRNHWQETSPSVERVSSEEVSEALKFVYSTYRHVLERSGKTESYIQKFLNDLQSEDQYLQDQRLTYRYVVYRRSPDEIRGVGRAVLIRADEIGQLPALIGTPLSHFSENRVQLGRLVGVSELGQTPVTQELAYTLATFLNGYFRGDKYCLFVRTDKARAKLYQLEYPFQLAWTARDSEDPNGYLLSAKGSQYYDIYVDHILTAYGFIIRERDFGKAIEHILKHQADYKLKNYGPSLNALAHIKLIHEVFSRERVSLDRWHEMTSLSQKSQDNLDFEIIFKIRAQYDLITARGDVDLARKSLEEYLLLNPMDPSRDQKRARLFQFYRAFYAMHAGDVSNVSQWRKAAGASPAGDSALAAQCNGPASRFLEPTTNPLLVFTNPFLMRRRALELEAGGYPQLARRFYAIAEKLEADYFP